MHSHTEPFISDLMMGIYSERDGGKMQDTKTTTRWKRCRQLAISYQKYIQIVPVDTALFFLARRCRIDLKNAFLKKETKTFPHNWIVSSFQFIFAFFRGELECCEFMELTVEFIWMGRFELKFVGFLLYWKK